ncbi:hypothetical protein AN218_22295 [Streptomyces nanshensis]|uniref:Uncharacterized protein n=2 Tax=Streptomyces nanshensis TaxID=518642 RepID=A0A1E7KZ54_9ACTN|nr:hypothetical protein AN218_22295 [Streptomyces nanshensis]
MSVGLVAPAKTELEWLASHLGLSQVDVINRALQIYGYVERQRAVGGEVLIRHNGETEKIHII